MHIYVHLYGYTCHDSIAIKLQIIKFTTFRFILRIKKGLSFALIIIHMYIYVYMYVSAYFNVAANMDLCRHSYVYVYASERETQLAVISKINGWFLVFDKIWFLIFYESMKLENAYKEIVVNFNWSIPKDGDYVERATQIERGESNNFNWLTTFQKQKTGISQYTVSFDHFPKINHGLIVQNSVSLLLHTFE